MITEELKQLVREEADAIKANATAEEIGRLDFDWLDPIRITRCIYGQMTGDCFSQRAFELIRKCAIPVAKLSAGNPAQLQHKRKTWRGLDEERDVNGSYVYLTAIETYILDPEAKNANLIAYLKGESDTLEL